MRRLRRPGGARGQARARRREYLSHVAQGLALDEVMAGVLPEGKAEVVARLRAHGPVAMVGDGVNNAPAPEARRRLARWRRQEDAMTDKPNETAPKAGYIPKPPSPAELDQVSRDQALITD